MQTWLCRHAYADMLMYTHLCVQTPSMRKHAQAGMHCAMQTGMRCCTQCQCMHACLTSGGAAAEAGSSSQGQKLADERADTRQESGAAA